MLPVDIDIDIDIDVDVDVDVDIETAPLPPTVQSNKPVGDAKETCMRMIHFHSGSDTGIHVSNLLICQKSVCPSG